MEEQKSGMELLIAGLSTLTELLAVGLLWLLGCLPIITIGASSAAAYYTVVKSVRRQYGGIWQCFWHSFRENLLQGILCSLGLLAVGALLLFYLQAFHTMTTLQSIYRGLVILLLVLVVSLVIWLFPVISRFSHPLHKCLSISVCLAAGHPLRTVAALSFLLLSVIVAFFSPLLVAILSGLYNWGLSFLMEPVLRTLIHQEDSSGGDSWYLK